MLERLALSLGYGGQFLCVETLMSTGAEMRANPETALRHLAQAGRAAARPGVACAALRWGAPAHLLAQPHFVLVRRRPEGAPS